jgi:hypothetical protein
MVHSSPANQVAGPREVLWTVGTVHSSLANPVAGPGEVVKTVGTAHSFPANPAAGHGISQQLAQKKLYSQLYTDSSF